MGIVKDYVEDLAKYNGEAVAHVRGDVAIIAGWQRAGEPIALLWAALREGHGCDETTIADLQRAVKRAIPPWWAEYRPDEAGQSDAFLDRYGADWAYVTGWEHWHKWTGTHWNADQLRGLRLAVGQMLDTVYAEATEGIADLAQEAKERKAESKAAAAKLASFGKKPRLEDLPAVAEAEKAADKAQEQARQASADVVEAEKYAAAWRRTDRRIVAIDNLCKDQRAQHPDNLSAKNLLNLANGTLDLDSGALRPHDRADLLTHCLPYSYDPAAQCPRWLQFLSEVLVKEDGDHTPDPELAALFQEFIGYALTVETRYEAMLWLSGVGANGKTTAIKIVNALLGPLALSIDLGALGRPDASYYLAKLGGARVVFSTEATKGQNTGEDILKRLASGEPIPARPIRGEPITIQPVAKVLWAMNDKPNVKDTSDGFWRRLRLVPFYRQFGEHERDTQLAEQLLGELPGILNWALEGLRRLRSNGRFTDAAAVRDAVTEYRTSQNVVALWLQERTTHGLTEKVQAKIAADRGAPPETKAHDAFQDYLQWAAATNRQRTLTETAFGADLGKLAKSERKRAGKVYFFGLTTATVSATQPAPTAVASEENSEGSEEDRFLRENGF